MTFKYLSINVWLGGKQWDDLVAFLKQEDADIVALQEVYNSKDPKLEKCFRTMQALNQELRYPHTAFAVAMIDSEYNLPWGNAVLSKFPITKQEAIFFDVPFGEREMKIENAEHAPRNMLHAAIDANGTTLNIFSIHGIWGYDGDDNPRRLAMSDTIIQHTKNLPHVILSGDFNVKENTETIKNLEPCLKNVFKGERTTSFNMRIKTDQRLATAVVDHLLVSPDLRVIEHRQPDVDASDHLPMVAAIEIP